MFADSMDIDCGCGYALGISNIALDHNVFIGSQIEGIVVKSCLTSCCWCDLWRTSAGGEQYEARWKLMMKSSPDNKN